MLKDDFWLHALIVMIGGVLGLSKVDNDKRPSPVVEFPETKAPVKPTVSEPVSTLAVGELYVIDSSVKALVTSSPKGRVKVTQQPLAVGERLTVIGKFVDGRDVEIRNYKADGGPRFLYIVTAVSKGPVEIIVATELDERSVVTRTLEVTGGGGVLPEPEAPPLVKDLQTAFAQEPAEERVLLAKLVQVYEYTAGLVNKDATWAALFRSMQAKSEGLQLNGKLMRVKALIQAELKKVLPSGVIPDTLVVGDDTVKAKAAFDAIVSGLKQVR